MRYLVIVFSGAEGRGQWEKSEAVGGKWGSGRKVREWVML